MATTLQKEEKTRGQGELARGRSTFPLMPDFFERAEEMFNEPLFRWPLRLQELGLPKEIVRVPAMDIFEDGDTIVVKAEVPGLTKADLDVRIAGDVLTVSGNKEKEERIERKDYHRYERSSGSFCRSVLLPAEVEIDKVSAQVKDGVLEIRAPKSSAARARSRTIEVR
jgi:HSP20 family protein